MKILKEKGNRKGRREMSCQMWKFQTRLLTTIPIVTYRYPPYPSPKPSELKTLRPIISLLGPQNFCINLFSLVRWPINVFFLVSNVDVHSFNWITGSWKAVMMSSIEFASVLTQWLWLVLHVRLGLYKCQHVK